nr:hypothetical protein [Tanacetum cinerariifolium]
MWLQLWRVETDVECVYLSIKTSARLSKVQLGYNMASKDIVKEVKNYLKTYSSAGMDISWWDNSIKHYDGTKTVPPTSPPPGTNPGNAKSPKRVDTVPIDNTNNTSTNNVTPNVVAEDLPQLLDSRGALEGENVQGTFTRLRILLNDLENKGVSIPQVEVNGTFANNLPRKWLSMNQTQRANNSIKNNSLATLFGKNNYKEDVEEDTKSSSEFLADLNVEFYDRALLAN